MERQLELCSLQCQVTKVSTHFIQSQSLVNMTTEYPKLYLESCDYTVKVKKRVCSIIYLQVKSQKDNVFVLGKKISGCVLLGVCYQNLYVGRLRLLSFSSSLAATRGI